MRLQMWLILTFNFRLNIVFGYGLPLRRHSSLYKNALTASVVAVLVAGFASQMDHHISSKSLQFSIAGLHWRMLCV